MKKFTAKIIDPIGLHARPASKIVQLIARSSDEIKIISGDNDASLKSIIGIMSLGVKSGQEVTIEVTGSTEDDTIALIEKTMKSEKLI